MSGTVKKLKKDTVCTYLLATGTGGCRRVPSVILLLSKKLVKDTGEWTLLRGVNRPDVLMITLMISTGFRSATPFITWLRKRAW